MSISKAEFARRRKQLMGMLESNSIAILPSGEEKIRSRDTDYPFRQDSDFLYLTGFQEPESVLVLIPGREHGEVVWFCREKDREREIWDGMRAGPEGVCQHYGADDAFPIGDIDEILPGMLEGRERVYYTLGKNPAFDKHLMDWVNAIRAKARSGAAPPGDFLDLDHILHDMRLYKSAEEVRTMEKAGDISARAHKRAMEICQPGMMEYELEAEINYVCAREGGRHPAYNSIVGSGKNACILHYVENSAKMKSGDLVLIDAGCELENYASDITRTFPVNGKFSEEQAAVYQLVLDAQSAAMEKIHVGNHWNEPHDASVRTITEGLLKLGLLEGDVDELIEKNTYKDFYMHRIGHWIGMDVHDVGDYKVGGEWRVLEAGMMMTVEPGIYIAHDNTDVPAKWRGIGVRIEDDVLVTKDGPKVLTSAAPKTIDEIEAVMAG